MPVCFSVITVYQKQGLECYEVCVIVVWMQQVAYGHQEFDIFIKHHHKLMKKYMQMRCVLRQHVTTDLVSWGYGKENTYKTNNIKAKIATQYKIKLPNSLIWVDCPFFRALFMIQENRKIL